MLTECIQFFMHVYKYAEIRKHRYLENNLLIGKSLTWTLLMSDIGKIHSMNSIGVE